MDGTNHKCLQKLDFENPKISKTHKFVFLKKKTSKSFERPKISRQEHYFCSEVDEQTEAEVSISVKKIFTNLYQFETLEEDHDVTNYFIKNFKYM